MIESFKAFQLSVSAGQCGGQSCKSYTAGGYVGLYKMMQKTWKITEPLAHGYSSESTQQELSNEYQHDRV